MKKKVTIKDVAKHAGVSSAAVSYVLNGKNKVSGETKEKIRRSIEELHYLPDLTAISLSKKQSKLIGLLKILNQDSLLPVFQTNLYYNEFISGVESVARGYGYDILLAGIGVADECSQWVQRRNLDGLIVMNASGSIAEELARHIAIPIVLVDTYDVPEGSYHTMNIDDEEGGYQATAHLLSLGHTSIAMVVAEAKNSPVDEQRLKGYKRALKEFGIPFKQELIFESGNSTLEASLDAGQSILDSSEPITAVFATSDIVCLGIMRRFASMGKKIPQDFSIVGFDDLNVSQYLSPSLTTVRQDILAKGIQSSEMIFSALFQKEQGLTKKVLPVELAVRESTMQIT
ncbi:LacI family DNA-binding transcriptional regulator [Metabacillus sp. KIGAM252]|uniref:LacI family DNA-binding transcriptional regulator n=1 Tax=Metabacillus flavus TaxID=2823519 RepID=A0ABS5LD88_9BACI|nr:LacI family DNA-binding transcriptional regulator [Metabacillus flavus]MBS2968713.1 LacI family DNA-binding transcriptional regulator [Metabacillus flavus]